MSLLWEWQHKMLVFPCIIDHAIHAIKFLHFTSVWYVLAHQLNFLRTNATFMNKTFKQWCPKKYTIINRSNNHHSVSPQIIKHINTTTYANRNPDLSLGHIAGLNQIFSKFNLNGNGTNFDIPQLCEWSSERSFSYIMERKHVCFGRDDVMSVLH